MESGRDEEDEGAEQSKSPCQEDEPKTRYSKPEDLLASVLDVCCIVQKAQKKAGVVEEKLEVIETLVEKARKEAFAMEDVVLSLSSTASSMAKMALEVCSYESLTDLFMNNKIFSDKFTLQEFLNIADKTNILRRVKRDANSTEDREQPEFVNSERYTLQQHSLSAFRPLVNENRRDSLPKEFKPGPILNKIAEKQIGKGQTAQKTSLGKFNRTVVDPGFETFMSVADRQLFKQKELQKFDERFPQPGTHVEDYKAHLHTNFGSSGNVAPLWEDRYIAHDSGTNIPSFKLESPVDSGTSWADKKAMKQFQLKFQKQKLLMASDDHVAIPDDEHINEMIKEKIRKEQKAIGAARFEELYDSDVDETEGDVQWDHDQHPRVSRLRHKEDVRSVETNLNRLARPHMDTRPISPLLNSQERGGFLPNDDGTTSTPHNSPRQRYLPSSGQSSRASSCERSETAETPKVL